MRISKIKYSLSIVLISESTDQRYATRRELRVSLNIAYLVGTLTDNAKVLHGAHTKRSIMKECRIMIIPHMYR